MDLRLDAIIPRAMLSVFFPLTTRPNLLLPRLVLQVNQNTVHLPILSYINYCSYAAAAAAESLQSCPTLCDPHRRQPIRLPRPWNSPGKNTGVGCHFILQCMKVKSESEVAQSCPTFGTPWTAACAIPGPKLLCSPSMLREMN